jgi:hypothetical protein
MIRAWVEKGTKCAFMLEGCFVRGIGHALSLQCAGAVFHVCLAGAILCFMGVFLLAYLMFGGGIKTTCGLSLKCGFVPGSASGMHKFKYD